MPKKRNIAIKLKTEKEIQQNKYSVGAVYNLIKWYKHKIKPAEYTLSPSCLGVSAYIYSVNTVPNITIECEIRDKHRPKSLKNYGFKYCHMIVKNNSKVVKREINTKVAQDIYLYMDELWNSLER